MEELFCNSGCPKTYSQDILLQSLADTEDQLVETMQALEEERKLLICDQEAKREVQYENRKFWSYCGKVFVSLVFLETDMLRRPVVIFLSLNSAHVYDQLQRVSLH
ncbi:hypothetical protein HPB52_012796 [Rhipicephalus sanguineus]|uniref:Uncharacterized protein n=1 Tax=Rhipicephalus sanguineus TaxID=34632 RepID=A0A9D4PW46_RHISA|nr:hypothetical protein HPB52_012796 [Rhipicephalus sanguineus]